MNGTYGFVYSGERGVGIGAFSVADGVLTGADYAGGRYRGTAAEDPATGEIHITVQQQVPANVPLAQGSAEQDLPLTRHLSFKAPPRFNNGEPFAIYLPGKLTVMVRRVPDDLAGYAKGFRLVPADDG